MNNPGFLIGNRWFGPVHICKWHINHNVCSGTSNASALLNRCEAVNRNPPRPMCYCSTQLAVFSVRFHCMLQSSILVGTHKLLGCILNNFVASCRVGNSVLGATLVHEVGYRGRGVRVTTKPRGGEWRLGLSSTIFYEYCLVHWLYLVLH